MIIFQKTVVNSSCLRISIGWSELVSTLAEILVDSERVLRNAYTETKGTAFHLMAE